MAISSPDGLYLLATLLCAALGAAYDLSSRRVPNFVTLPAALFGLGLHAALGGWSQLGSAAAAGLICLLLFAVFYLAGGMGAGDVKLMAATGCLAGLPHVATLLFLTALAGGVMALCLALYRGSLKQTMNNLGTLAVHHRTLGLRPHPQLHIGNAQTIRLPYALAITTGSAALFCLTVIGR
jgi:prepilin peptidase CpaA